MPSLPLKPCPGQGGRCGARVRQGRCPACSRASDQRRGSYRERGYGQAWRKARSVYLAMHPLCVLCAQAGRYVPATVVDHIMPHRGSDALMWDEANWQPLCASCHSRKTAREDGGFGNASRMPDTQRTHHRGASKV